jgi:hypothetical protein
MERVGLFFLPYVAASCSETSILSVSEWQGPGMNEFGAFSYLLLLHSSSIL